jgi:glycosyltransferase involved in cell wall biosynthesis
LKKIVFISHDGSRTGAPILLLNIIKLIKEIGKYELVAVFKNGGPIEEDYQEVVKTYLWNKQIKRPLPKGIIQRVKNKIWPIDHDQLNKHSILSEIANADYIINNTITNGELLEILTQNFKGKVISYIHELKMGSNRHATTEGILSTIRISENFIVPSNAVKKYLLNSFEIDSQKIFLVNSLLNLDQELITVNQINKKSKKFIVGGCGTADFGKGIEIFILVANYLVSNFQINNILFIWKGANPNSDILKQCIIDIEKCGLNDFVILAPADNKMYDFYNGIDLFLLSSREDSYPLVVLEAASFGKPIVCFDQAGGASEFVEDDAGSVVPYLDIISVANVILEYHENTDLLNQHGEIAKERVQKKHQDKNLILSQLNQILKD